VSVIVGVSLIGAVFYGLLSSHYLAAMLGRTLGPYSDALAQHALANRDPNVWAAMARQHGVAIRVELADGQVAVFDADGKAVSSLEPTTLPGRFQAVRTAPDGSRVVLSWSMGTFRESHLPMLGGLIVLLTLVVGAAFWFLQRQLRPLAWLRDGVEAVADGDFQTRVPVVRDDEIGQVAGSFNVMARRVGEMIDDRERLLADVSHELRSPIARMKVAVELLPEGDKRDSLARDLREMEHLIAVLLERERLRTHDGRLETRPVDLTVLVREVAAAFEGRKPGVEVHGGEQIVVQADAALIRLLAQNLVDNAVKFSLPDSRPVVVSLQPATDEVVLRVADDGVGIPAGGGPRLFEPFVKLDPARGHHGGYGLGLNLCQRIVGLHGGSIRLDRRDPRGTEVVVTLPRRPVRTGAAGG